MNIEDIITRFSGTITLPNGRRYFSSLLADKSFNRPHFQDWYVHIRDGMIYPLDAYSREVTHAGRKVEDIVFLYTEIDRIATFYPHWDMPRVVRAAEGRLKDFRKRFTVQGILAVINDDPKSSHLKKPMLIWTGQQLAEKARTIVAPHSYDMGLLSEEEITCVFGDSGVGKSAFAVQLADRISADHNVLLCDLHLSNQQFIRRHVDSEGRLYPFSPKFFRCNPHPEVFLSRNADMIILEEIEKIIIEQKIRVLVIDSVSALCKDAMKADKMAALIYHLRVFQKKYRIAVLLIADGAGNDDGRLVSRLDIAAPQILVTMVDRCLALVKSNLRRDTCYLKCLKDRFDSLKWDDEKVMVLERKTVKEKGMMSFEPAGFESELNLVRMPKKVLLEVQAFRVGELAAEGLTQREIAQRLQISLGKVNSLLNVGKKTAAVEEKKTAVEENVESTAV